MISPITFLKETQAELREVKWPTRENITRLTIIVLLVSIAVGAYIGVLDLLLTKLFELVIK